MSVEGVEGVVLLPASDFLIGEKDNINIYAAEFGSAKRKLLGIKKTSVLNVGYRRSYNHHMIWQDH